MSNEEYQEYIDSQYDEIIIEEIAEMLEETSYLYDNYNSINEEVENFQKKLKIEKNNY